MSVESMVLVLCGALTKFGSVQNPFVEEYDGGAQGDPCSAADQSISEVWVVNSYARALGHPHDIESWVYFRCWRLPLLDFWVDSRQNWHGGSCWPISDYLCRYTLLFREGFLRVSHVDSG